MFSLARCIVHHAKATLLVAIALAIASGVYGIGLFQSFKEGGFGGPTDHSTLQVEYTQRAFGNQGEGIVVEYSHPEWTYDQDRFKNAVRESLSHLDAQRVTDVTSVYSVVDGAQTLAGQQFDEQLAQRMAATPAGAQPAPVSPSAAAEVQAQRAAAIAQAKQTAQQAAEKSLVSEDRRAVLVTMAVVGEDHEAQRKNYEAIEPHFTSDDLTVRVGGLWPMNKDINAFVKKDLQRAEFIALPIVFVISILIFGSLTAAAMPVVVGVVALLGSMAFLRLLTLFTDVSVFSVNVTSVIGMGLAVDYSLFVISRFREELALRTDHTRASSQAAMMTTLLTAGRTVLFSGLIVAASLASMLVFPQSFLKSIAWGGMSAVLVAMVAALTILPAILVLLGHRVDAFGLPQKWRPNSPENSGKTWARIGRTVMRRPVVYVAVITGLLVAMSWPFIGVKWGNVDHNVLPHGAPSRVAIEEISRQFGGEKSTATIYVESQDADIIEAYRKKVAAVPGVQEVTISNIKQATVNKTQATLDVRWLGNAQSDTSQSIVQDIRALGDPTPGVSYVGGTSAVTIDLIASIKENMPRMIAVVALTMFVLLFLAFGSVVLPIKAMAMNVISLGASFGAVAWVFADGNLHDVMNFTPRGFLDVTQPIIILAIAFGLSMDYEVFLLSRVREEYLKTGNTHEAIVNGLRYTGGIITSAAILLGVVIGAMATSAVLVMKLIGLGMLVAVLLDATIVRGVLVPATMALLGRWNWWAPGPLRRWHTKHVPDLH